MTKARSKTRAMMPAGHQGIELLWDVGLVVGLTPAPGLPAGNGNGPLVGRLFAGKLLTVGMAVGIAVGIGLLASVGLFVGTLFAGRLFAGKPSAGTSVGFIVGLNVGLSVGLCVGLSVGLSAGLKVGLSVGLSVVLCVVGVGMRFGDALGITVVDSTLLMGGLL